MIRPLNVQRILMLQKSYNIFKYERTSTESRGLPHIDKFKEEYKAEEDGVEDDTTDRSVENAIQVHLKNHARVVIVD